MIGKRAFPMIAIIFAVGFSTRADEPNALADQQNKIAETYRDAEMLMLKMAQVDAAENPRRAALLKRVLSQSKEKFVRAQMETLVKSLQNQKLARAIDDQAQVRDDLKLLLQLLESENRTDRIKNQQARTRQYIRELQRIIRKHKSVQGRTEGGDSPNRLAGEQEKVADRTDQLSKQIEENESPPGADSETQDTNEKNKNSSKEDGQSAQPNSEDSGKPDSADTTDDPSDSPNGKPSAAKDSQRKPAQGDPKSDPPSEGNQGQPNQGQPNQGQPNQGQPNQGQPNQGQDQPDPPQQSFPGQKQIAEAEKKMRDAQRQLEESKIQGAIQRQEQARQLLEQAKAELEEILRQLREEEVERTLARLESRFKKMLETQIRIYEETKTLGNVPVPQRNNAFNIRTGKLALEERRLVADADRALLLLLEEGSSVTFPEATQQIRDDMTDVVDRLTDGKVGQYTQSIEEEIISALEQMLDALQKAQRDNEERKENQPQPQPMPMQSQPQENPLVDSIAELKMIRSMQQRINDRTQRMSRLLEDVDNPVGQITKLDQIESLRRLGAREERLKEITRDIVKGKNR